MEDYHIKYACPECKRETEYHSNPAYIHICESCGYKTTESNLIKAIDSEETGKSIERKFEEIERLGSFLNEYPSLKSLLGIKEDGKFASKLNASMKTTRQLVKNYTEALKNNK